MRYVLWTLVTIIALISSHAPTSAHKVFHTIQLTALKTDYCFEDRFRQFCLRKDR